MAKPTSHSMTPRQRWLALFDGQQPDHLPTDYWATPEFHAKLKTALGCQDDQALWQRLHIDRPLSVEPTWKLKHHPDDPQGDMWGIHHQAVDYGTGTYQERVDGPLRRAQTVEDVLRFRWPSPDDFDYSPITEMLGNDKDDRLRLGGGFEPFLIYAAMRGMEQAYEDLLLAPEIAEAALGKLFEFHYERNRRTFEAARGRIDVMSLAEDLGGQTGPLFGLDTFRRFLLPNMKRMADLARSHGARIMYHTDGAAQVYLPDLVDEVGIDILNPIQWRCPGMERETLARDYGDRVIFHGAIDNQQTLPFGSVDDVVNEVRQTAEIFRDCRWICAPCHNIQAVSPAENVIALYETAHSLAPNACL